MPEFGIDVRMDPSGARRGSQAVGRNLRDLEKQADRLSRKMGQAVNFDPIAGRFRTANGAIVRTSQSAQRAAGNVRQVGVEAQRTGGLLRNAFVAVGIGILARETLGLINTFGNLENRLRTVTEGEENLARVQSELFEISQDTRQSYESSVEMFARVGLAAKDLGTSQQELLQLTKSLNQAVVLSGASSQEASAGLLQLSQGLASGTLRGDELRSVLEQLPVIADVIAKSMGITRGELRDMGAEGKITADIVLQAFKESREELEERFGKTVPTIGQSFQVLRNEVLLFVGELSKSSGVTEAISRTLMFLANNLDTIVRVLGALAIRVGVFAAFAAGTRLWNAALKANPLLLIASALTTVVGLLVTFSDKIRISSEESTTLKDVMISLFNELANAISTLIQMLGAAFGKIRDFFASVFDGLQVGFEDVVMFASMMADSVIKIFTAAGKLIAINFALGPAAIADAIISLVNFVLEQVEKMINQAIEGIRFLMESMEGFSAAADAVLARVESIEKAGGFRTRIDVGRAGNPFEGAMAKFGEEFNQVFADLFSGNAGPIQRFFGRVFEGARARSGGSDASQGGLLGGGAGADTGAADGASKALQKQIAALDQLERSLNPVLDAQRELGDTYELLTSLYNKGEITFERHQQLMNAQTQALRDQLDPLGAVKRDLNEQIETQRLANEGKTVEIQLRQLEQRLQAQGITLDQQERDELRTKLGLLEQLGEATEEQTEKLTQMQQLGVGAFESLGGALREFIETGELDFERFVERMLQQLALLAAQQLLTAGAGAAGGGTTSSLLGALATGLGGAAHGASFRVPGSGGTDSVPVAFMATPGEHIQATPPGRMRSREPEQRGQAPVNLQVVNQTDPHAQIDAMNTQSGARVIQNRVTQDRRWLSRVLGN